MTKLSGDAGDGYHPAWWLPGGHVQTIWGKLARRSPDVPTSRTCLVAPDGDNLEVHSLDAAPDAPRVLLLHGLEGSRASHYVGGLLAEAQRREWGADLLVFRGCGDVPNAARRFYHSGETTDLAYTFEHLRSRWPDARWFLAGVSLGGNVLLKWLGEAASGVDARIHAAAAVSVPFDLEAGSRHISRGFARVYDRNFLRTLRHKARMKLARYPDLFDVERLERARSVFEFDDAVTAPVHDFLSAADYYARSSSLLFLPSIRIPTLLLSAANDPFLPRQVLDRVTDVASRNDALTVEIHASGGHVGFVEGALPWRARYYAEGRVFRFFDAALERVGHVHYD